MWIVTIARAVAERIFRPFAQVIGQETINHPAESPGEDHTGKMCRFAAALRPPPSREADTIEVKAGTATVALPEDRTDSDIPIPV